MAFRGMLEDVPSFAQTLARNLGSGMGRGLEKSGEFAQRMSLRNPQALAGVPEEDLIRAGYSPEDARLFSNLTKGSQTAFTKNMLESRKRQEPSIEDLSEFEESAESQFKEKNQKTGEEKEEKSSTSAIDRKLKNYILSRDKGMTPAERIRAGKERYATGLKPYQEATSKLRNLAREKQNMDMLESLNHSGKLPSGLDRFNVDDAGNLKVPFGASPEAERYVKILNEFSSGARDTFGTRVTNFDLSQFLKRYPTLLNSGEGRRQLLKQMKIVNDINSVYYRNLKNVYDKSGGVRKIDSDVAERFAEELSAPQIEKLVDRFDTISEGTPIPSTRMDREVYGFKRMHEGVEDALGLIPGVSLLKSLLKR